MTGGTEVGSDLDSYGNTGPNQRLTCFELHYYSSLWMGRSRVYLSTLALKLEVRRGGH